MATLVNNSSGNFTSAATWSVVEPTSYLNTETNSSNLSTTLTNTQAFTPGAVTVDGIALRVQAVNTTSGTIFTRLAVGGVPVAGTTVTINMVDISPIAITHHGWVFFKFAAPVTLSAATAYTVQAQTSVASPISLYRSATANDWCRYLRTTTTQAPAASDTLYINGEYISAGTYNPLTVTMNNTTSTIFGAIEIGPKGSLVYSTAASTALQLRLAGNLTLNALANLTIGTSPSPIPSTSTATLEFVVGSTGQYGISMRDSSTFNTYGASKTGRAFLAADAAAGATSITTDSSTGWSSGDTIALATTTTLATDCETVTLTGNASGASVPISALTNAHTGTGAYIGEVINLTRNINIIGQSISLQTFITITSAPSSQVINLNYTDFRYCPITYTGTLGSLSISGCSFRNNEVSGSNALSLVSSANANINDCVFYRNASYAISAIAANTNLTVNNCWGIYNLTANGIFVFANISGSITNIIAAGSVNVGVTISSITDGALITFSNIIAHGSANANNGLLTIASISTTGTPITHTNLTAWGGNKGIQIIGACNAVLDSCNIHSNAALNVYFLSVAVTNVLIKNSTFNGGTLQVSPRGIGFAVYALNIRVENCTFGATTAHGTSDISTVAGNNAVTCYLNNCLLASSLGIGQVANMSSLSFIASSKHNQVANAFSIFQNYGTLSKDSVIYDSPSASVRLTPSKASPQMLETVSKDIIVPSGRALKVTVAVRTSVSGDGAVYNGPLPRLILQKNNAIGLSTDTVLATATSASAGAFKNISGLTPTATDDGVFSVYVDCAGTVGFVNVDTWKCEII